MISKNIIKLDADHSGLTSVSLEPVISVDPYSYRTKNAGNSKLSILKSRTKPFDFQKKDTIFFLQGCTVPRGKFKVFCDEHKIKVTRDIKKAKYVVLSDDTLDSGIDTTYEYTCKLEDIVSLFEDGGLIPTNLVSDFKLALTEVEPNSKVLLKHQARYALNKLFNSSAFLASNKLYGKNNSGPNCDYSLVSRFSDTSIEDLLENKIPNIVLVHQDSLLSSLNKTNVIDEEMYLSLKTLFESNSSSDITIGMEILANSDYESSLMFTMLIFKEYGGEIFSSPTRNHVNFKALLNYLKITQYDRISIDTVINKLKVRGLFTQYCYDYISPIYIKEITETFERQGYEHSGVKPDAFFLNVQVDEPIINIEDPVLTDKLETIED